MPPWYALHVASCCESLVATKLQDVGLESYFPTMKRRSVRLYRPDIDQVLFPGYLFANFNLQNRTLVLQIPQVIRILGWGREPEEIPVEDVESIRTITAKGIALSIHPCAITGQRVRIGSGPLTGVTGIVVYVKNQARVIVSVAMLQQSISAEVDADSLEVLAA